jgi:hypothetical protein
MVAVPEASPLVALPRKPSVVAPGGRLTAIVWPLAWTLSGLPAATLGQVKVMPLTVVCAPGARPALVRACAE